MRERSRSRDRGTTYFEDIDKEDARKKIRALFKTFYDYTDDNNPFGDPELSKPFIWHKKIEKLRSKGLEPFLDSKSLILKLKKTKPEIDKTRRQRVQREEIKDIISDDKIKQLRNKEEQSYEDWKRKDEKFHLAQEKLRTEIRINQGREKPVDFLNKVLMIWKNFYPIPPDFFEIPEYQHPHLLYELLDLETLKELRNDLNTQLAIDKERQINKKFVCFYIDIAANFKQHHDISESDIVDFLLYWNSLICIIDSFIYPEKNIKNLDPEIRSQIEDVLKDYKDEKELAELENIIEGDLKELVLSSDIQFWNNVLCNLRILRCQKALDSLYVKFKTVNFEKLESLKKLQEQVINPDVLGVDLTSGNEIKYEEEGNLSPPMYESDEEIRKGALGEHDYLIKIAETRKILLAQLLSKWKGSYGKEQKKEETKEAQETQHNISQQTKKVNLMEVDDFDSEEEVEKFLAKGKKNKGAKVPTTVGTYKNQTDLLLGTGCYPIDTIKASRFNLKDDLYDYTLSQEMMLIQAQELGVDEAIFNDAVLLNNVKYLWSNTYQPRKPRYFNRVKSGYEWNKYNQSHYDLDSPPPKIIQGYKFNIFYPDLVDKTKAPIYTLERSDTPETCIIRFIAGPPYEDIAFRIVNREWDMSERAGFTNVFDRGILYVYFNFKRYRYKR
jgi:hypothetical protein